jgi:hypothetical protein
MEPGEHDAAASGDLPWFLWLGVVFGELLVVAVCLAHDWGVQPF